jgi:ectoine hydroxylase
VTSESDVQLDADQIAQYRRDGFLVFESLFDEHETAQLVRVYERDREVPGDHRILEPDGTGVRAVYASHLRQPAFAALIRAARVLGPVQQLLSTDVYLYQFKINAKPAFGGNMWAWHQDFAAWQLADNLPAPRLVNVAYFLDDVTEYNGPVIFVPGSHRGGLMRDARSQRARSEQHLDPDDIALGLAEMTALVDSFGMASPKGPAGTVVFFDPQIVHGSAVNMSPFGRRLLIMTYNDVANPPRPVGEPRPAYVVGRDTTPLRIAADALEPSIRDTPA